VDNRGMRQLLDERWEGLGCRYLLNEGGLGLQGALFEGQDVFAVSVAEKGVLWLRLTARGPGGHGSTPRESFAPARLLRVLSALRAAEPAPRFDPALLDLFSLVGDDGGGLKGFVLARPALLRAFGLGELMAEPGVRAALTNTLHVTGLRTGDHQPNVVPGEASALIDARLLPGVTAEEMVAHIESLIPEEERAHVRLEVLHAVPAAVTEWEGDELYGLVDAALRAGFTERPLVVAPALSVGFTDSIFARQRGARAFGVAPFLITQEEAESMHGEDERLSTRNLAAGVEFFLRVAGSYAAMPATSLPLLSPSPSPSPSLSFRDQRD